MPPNATNHALGGAGLGMLSFRERIDGSQHNSSKTAAPKLALTNVRSIGKKSLVGAFDLHLPSGLIILGAMLMQSNGKRWVNLPAKPYQNPDGSPGWQPIIDFESREAKARFQSQVLPLAEEALL